MMVAKVLGPKDLHTYERFVIEECEYNERLPNSYLRRSLYSHSSITNLSL